MSQTYFRKKATPLTPQMFPAKYLAILDITPKGLECLSSNMSFDLQKSLDEADEHKLKIIKQIASAYTKEIALHMRRGNRDHWLFTYEDSITSETTLDLVLSQNFLNKCGRKRLYHEIHTALMALAAFTYEMEEGGVKYFTPIPIQSEFNN